MTVFFNIELQYKFKLTKYGSDSKQEVQTKQPLLKKVKILNRSFMFAPVAYFTFRNGVQSGVDIF